MIPYNFLLSTIEKWHQSRMSERWIQVDSLCQSNPSFRSVEHSEDMTVPYRCPVERRCFGTRRTKLEHKSLTRIHSKIWGGSNSKGVYSIVRDCESRWRPSIWPLHSTTCVVHWFVDSWRMWIYRVNSSNVRHETWRKFTSSQPCVCLT